MAEEACVEVQWRDTQTQHVLGSLLLLEPLGPHDLTVRLTSREMDHGITLGLPACRTLSLER